MVGSTQRENLTHLGKLTHMTSSKLDAIAKHVRHLENLPDLEVDPNNAEVLKRIGCPTYAEGRIIEIVGLNDKYVTYIVEDKNKGDDEIYNIARTSARFKGCLRTGLIERVEC